MRIGSLFSGIGGLELGLEWAGVGHTVWQCEFSDGQGDLLGAENTFARAVLKRHWPDAIIYDDVRTMGTVDPLPLVDVLCGGFPCQDISVGNVHGEGLKGKRSGLFWEIIRIAKLIEPRFIVLENVANLVNKGLAEVLGALAEIGYDAEWHTLSAADIGAPHLRKRVFIIAWRQVADSDVEPDSALRGERANGQKGGLVWSHDRRSGKGASRRQRPDVGSVLGQEMADDHDEGPQRHAGDGSMGDKSRRIDERQDVGTIGNDSFQFPPGPTDVQLWSEMPVDSKPAVCRGAYGLSPWVVYRKSILMALGNAVVPQCAEVIGRRLLEINEVLT